MTSEKDYEKNNVIVGNYDLTPFPYKHWTIKEIFDQPNTINNSLNKLETSLDLKLGK